MRLALQLCVFVFSLCCHSLHCNLQRITVGWNSAGRTLLKKQLLDFKRTKMIISNICTSPASSCSNGYQSSIEHLLATPDTLILGDFNAHHLSWYSRSTDTRGKRMDDLINGSNFGILNWDSPTRVPPNAEPH